MLEVKCKVLLMPGLPQVPRLTAQCLKRCRGRFRCYRGEGDVVAHDTTEGR
jgi:hypothetical protein